MCVYNHHQEVKIELPCELSPICWKRRETRKKPSQSDLLYPRLLPPLFSFY